MAHDLLKGKKGIVFGALNDMSIAWKVALEAHAQGAEIVLTNAPVAMRMGEIHNLAKLCGDAPVIPADATSEEDLQNLFEGAMEHFGGKVDFVLHSIGMSPNVRKGKHYTDINYKFLQTTLDVSAISLHKTLATAKKLDALNEWGSVVSLSYIAAQRIFPDYGDMADAKSLVGKHHPQLWLPLRGGQEDPRQHCQPVAHGDHGRQWCEGLRRVHQLQRGDVAAWQRRCAVLRRVLHHVVQRFDALRDDANAVPRRRVLQHRGLHGGDLEVWPCRGVSAGHNSPGNVPWRVARPCRVCSVNSRDTPD